MSRTKVIKETATTMLLPCETSSQPQQQTKQEPLSTKQPKAKQGAAGQNGGHCCSSKHPAPGHPHTGHAQHSGKGHDKCCQQPQQQPASPDPRGGATACSMHSSSTKGGGGQGINGKNLSSKCMASCVKQKGSIPSNPMAHNHALHHHNHNHTGHGHHHHSHQHGSQGCCGDGHRNATINGVKIVVEDDDEYEDDVHDCCIDPDHGDDSDCEDEDDDDEEDDGEDDDEDCEEDEDEEEEDEENSDDDDDDGSTTSSNYNNSASGGQPRDLGRVCDCCYCEVFGHGVPSISTTSRNYSEMRERLRMRLSKRKAERKQQSSSNPGSNGPQMNGCSTTGHGDGCNPAILPQTGSTTVTTSTSSVSKNGDHGASVRGTEDVEALLSFINGTDSSSGKGKSKKDKKKKKKEKSGASKDGGSKDAGQQKISNSLIVADNCSKASNDSNPAPPKVLTNNNTGSNNVRSASSDPSVGRQPISNGSKQSNNSKPTSTMSNGSITKHGSVSNANSATASPARSGNNLSTPTIPENNKVATMSSSKASNNQKAVPNNKSNNANGNNNVTNGPSSVINNKTPSTAMSVKSNNVSNGLIAHQQQHSNNKHQQHVKSSVTNDLAIKSNSKPIKGAGKRNNHVNTDDRSLCPGK